MIAAEAKTRVAAPVQESHRLFNAPDPQGSAPEARQILTGLGDQVCPADYLTITFPASRECFACGVSCRTPHQFCDYCRGGAA